MRIGTKTIGVMDVKNYDISKHIYNGADNKKYELDNIDYFILTKEEYLKLIDTKKVKEKIEIKNEEKVEIKNEIKVEEKVEEQIN
jgi:hypothetical protein